MYKVFFLSTQSSISIHALREEGDKPFKLVIILVKIFLSTPSARRATEGGEYSRAGEWISIHAIREEGDGSPPIPAPGGGNFYPRPPRGGRLLRLLYHNSCKKFLSTPSARRAT